MQEKQNKRQRVNKTFWFKKSQNLIDDDIFYVENVGLCKYTGEKYEEWGYLIFVMKDEKGKAWHVASELIFLASKEEKVAYCKS